MHALFDLVRDTRFGIQYYIISIFQPRNGYSTPSTNRAKNPSCMNTVSQAICSVDSDAEGEASYRKRQGGVAIIPWERRYGKYKVILYPNIHDGWMFSPFSSSSKGGSYGNKILYKNLDLTQDFPNKISFHFLWVKMLPKNLPKIFRWPEMCPLGKILA